MTNVLMIEAHPIHYRAKLYARLASQEFRFKVLFCSRLYATPNYDPGFQTEIESGVELFEGYEHEFLTNWGRETFPTFFSKINPGVIRHIGSADVVIIHGFGVLSNWIALFAAKLRGKRVVINDDRTLEAYETMPAWQASVRRGIICRLLRLSDAVLYACAANREYWIAHGVAEDCLFPMLCSVDNDYFRGEHTAHLPRRGEIRAGLGIGPADYALIFPARLIVRKHPRDLLEALLRLPDAVRKAVVTVFVGSGPEEKCLRKLCESRGLKAVFTGYKRPSEISPYYTAADAYVMISEYDPSPKAMNEAMNFALPVICTTSVGTAGDLVRPGKNGFLVSVGDIDGLAHSVRTLVEDRDLSVEMGRASRDIVSQYTFAKGAEGFVAAVRAVTESSSTEKSGE